MDGLPNAGPFRLEVFRQPNDPYDLKLVLINRLDREARDHYNLLLTAADGGPAPGPLEGSMILSVTVDDVNDNPPVFDRSRYRRESMWKDKGIRSYRWRKGARKSMKRGKIDGRK